VPLAATACEDPGREFTPAARGLHALNLTAAGAISADGGVAQRRSQE